METKLNFQAPCVNLKSLDNLWLQLTTIACNLKCKHCYLGCSPNNKKKSFIPLDKVKSALEQARKMPIKHIYVNGGEPLLHSDFNTIVRMSLKITNVTILTNGTLINDKKARFMRQIENEHTNELIFRIALDHYTEEKHDALRGKGSFKKTMNGIANLLRYEFNPIISITNVYEEDEDHLREKFAELMKRIDFDTDDINFKIFPCAKLGEFAKNYKTYSDEEFVNQEVMQGANSENYDCANSRVVSSDGVYACPMLVNDPRGKVGSNMEDFAQKVFLETSACYTCRQHNDKMHCNNW